MEQVMEDVTLTSWTGEKIAERHYVTGIVFTHNAYDRRELTEPTPTRG
jgi:hypothetical protein